jgi:hypothetical protein
VKKYFVASCMILLMYSQGCKTEHKVEVEVKPMQITVDVNIRIDRELENFFGSIDQAAHTISGQPAACGTQTTTIEAGKTEEAPTPAQ